MRTAALAIAAALFAGPALAQGANTQAAIERGLYLTRVGDCAACHTVEEDKPFAGNFELPTPFGNIYTSNLTPDEDTGLGTWTADDFFRAMTQGVRPDEERLYPAFPYTHFNIVTREDSDAIFAYLRTLEPVRQIVREPDFPWPMSDRTTLRVWNFLNFEEDDFVNKSDKSPAWNRGRYLVEGLAHCSGCHSPRNFTGAEKDGEARFTGGFAEGWYAPSLRQGNGGEGIGDWSAQDLAEFLRHGRNDHTAAFGPMAEVIDKSTRHLKDDDLNAIVTYIRDLPEEPEAAERPEPVASDDEQMIAGETIYATQCGACHGQQGEGVPGMFATLKGSSLVHSADTTTLVRLIIEGVRAVPTDKYPTPHAMPAFGWKLTDQDIADVATYVRNAFGNAAPAVAAGDVEDIRKQE
ncbi:c-type cytochrome [Tepidamorphus sp. 3E244]|uniref:c-type cytochrome n=1 Tax=Tepidamorphus sp. 3E244 TaxID=3385498 RepID=UPI0038FC189E